MNKIGVRIKTFREERGIRQEYMADEMEISQSNYSRLEKDDRRLTVPKLLKIAQVLNIPLSSLFNEKDFRKIHENDEIGNSEQSKMHYEHEHILSLKEEINFLRKMLSHK